MIRSILKPHKPSRGAWPRRGDLAAKLKQGFRLSLSRDPNERELDRLVKLYGEARTRYSVDENLAQQMATTPIGPIPSGTNVVDLATLTVVGNVLLNLDETLMKR